MPTFSNEHFRKLLVTFPEKAIEILYAHEFLKLVKLSIYYTRNQAASEDIVQQAFIHVWEQRNWFDKYHTRSVQHFLIKIVKNRSISWYKSNLRRIQRNGHYHYKMMTIETSIEMKLMSFERHQQIRDRIEQFPLREKQCLFLKIDHEQSPDEIALSLQISRKSVERALTSANKRLRNILQSI
jgi:RNA polymerase sigma-70 factor, ECF subfamily